MSSDFRLDPVVMQSIGDLNNRKFLDVGCGFGKWGYAVKLGWSGAVEYTVGLDVWRLNLKFVKKHKVYDDVILADARFLPFANKSFNIACACEFIHCLNKDEGIVILNELERVSGQRTIVSVPNKGMTFGVDPENPFEKNVSEWSAKELRNLGYDIMGIGFQFKGRRISPIILSGLTKISLLNKFAELLVGKKETSQ